MKKKRFHNSAQNIGLEIKIISELCKKSLRQNIRSRAFLIIAVLFPTVFLIMIRLAFGGALVPQPTYELYVIDNDTIPGGYSNLTTYLPSEYITFSEVFLEYLSNLTYATKDGSNTKEIFSIEIIQEFNDTIREDIIQNDILLVVIIPDNFTENMLTESKDIHLEVIGDPTFSTFQAAYSILIEQFNTFCVDYRTLMGFERWETEIIQTSTLEVTNLTYFDATVSAIIVLAITTNLTFVAMHFSEETEYQTLERLQMTPMKPYHIFGGMLFTQIIVAMIQTVVMLFLAFIMGFQGIGSFFLAGFIAVILSISITAIGLIIGAFVDKVNLAAGIGTLIVVPLVAITGGFLPVNSPTLFTIGSNSFELTDIFPTSVAYEMLHRILVFDQNLSDLGFEFSILVITTSVLIVIGLLSISLFKLRIRKE